MPSSNERGYLRPDDRRFIRRMAEHYAPQPLSAARRATFDQTLEERLTDSARPPFLRPASILIPICAALLLWFALLRSRLPVRTSKCSLHRQPQHRSRKTRPLTPPSWRMPITNQKRRTTFFPLNISPWLMLLSCCKQAMMRKTGIFILVAVFTLYEWSGWMAGGWAQPQGPPAVMRLPVCALSA